MAQLFLKLRGIRKQPAAEDIAGLPCLNLRISEGRYKLKLHGKHLAVTVDLSRFMCGARANPLMVSMRVQRDEIKQQILYWAISRDVEFSGVSMSAVAELAGVEQHAVAVVIEPPEASGRVR